MNINKSLLQIAAQNNVSVTEVRRDIQEALDAGWNSPDPKVREYWSKVPRKHEKPTLEEAIEFMAKEVERKRKL